MPRTVKKAATPAAQDIVPAATDAPQEAVADEKREIRVKETLDPHQLVTVRNGFCGTLIYVSRRTGEKFLWDKLGDEQDMELQELRAARNASREFYENNWFMIDDPEVIAYLGVERYYKNALTIDGLDDVFTLPPSKLEAKIGLLSAGQKATLAYRARQLIRDGEIDSIKTIGVIEKCLGVELIEH